LSVLSIKKLTTFPLSFLKVYTPLWLVVFIILIAADLGSKLWMTDHLNYNLAVHQQPAAPADITARYDGRDQINLIGENGRLVKFRLVFNDRFVFGSGPSAPVLGLFITLGAIVFLVFYRWHNPLLGHSIAWLFVFSGAFGNLIDKMFVKSVADRSWLFSIGPKPGYVSGVVDFVECIWFGWDRVQDTFLVSFLSWNTWPTFNLADSLIVVGIGILIFTMREKA